MGSDDDVSAASLSGSESDENESEGEPSESEDEPPARKRRAPEQKVKAEARSSPKKSSPAASKSKKTPQASAGAPSFFSNMGSGLKAGGGGKPTPKPTPRLTTPKPTPASGKKAAGGGGGGGGGTDSPGCSTPGSGGKKLAAIGEGVFPIGKHDHDELSWLNEKRRDADGRSRDDPQFNPRTLKVDSKYLSDQTPAQQQYWDFKKDNMDVVLFFKVGKFYELFHLDADVGYKELDLIYMKGAKAHSGFPEIAYGKFSEQLVARGFRVARVEQTETPDLMAARLKKGKPKQRYHNDKTAKVVKREMCSVLSSGTRTHCHLDEDGVDKDAAAREKKAAEPVVATMLLTVTEQVLRTSFERAGEQRPRGRFGVCLSDAATGSFIVGEFADSRQHERLRTLLVHYPIAEVVYEQYNEEADTGLCPDVVKVIQHDLPRAVMTAVHPDDMPEAEDAWKDLDGKHYFTTPVDGEDVPMAQEEWPAVLLELKSGMDAAAAGPAEAADADGGGGALAIAALGGCARYLARAFIDSELLSMRNFSRHVPADASGLKHPLAEASAAAAAAAAETKAADRARVQAGGDVPDGELVQEHMVLDGACLVTLEIVQNETDGGRKGTLIEYMDRCQTPFGRRLLHRWTTAPLCRVGAIEERQVAVAELVSKLDTVMASVKPVLGKLPDVERLLSRVHSVGSATRATTHPDSRAIMYENPKYDKRKVRSLCDCITAFRRIAKLQKELAGEGSGGGAFEAPLLRRLLCTGADGGEFPDYDGPIKFFTTAFDAGKAAAEGKIELRDGYAPQYDEACASKRTVERRFTAYLEEQRQELGLGKGSLKYFGNNKDRYQIEIKDDDIRRMGSEPDGYQLKTKNKKVKRFWTAEIIDMTKDLVEAEAAIEGAMKDQMRTIFAAFDEHSPQWSTAVQCVATFDCLLSLAAVSQQEGFCLPRFSAPLTAANAPTADGPFLSIRGGRHPMAAAAMAGSALDFIPNDTLLGPDGGARAGTQEDARMLLLSGPNMGGKSTLLRQTCLLTIMAQMGCMVPAESLALTPVDRIFTRIGASDRILQGQSTFFVELSETATILHKATRHSLVILDELGRGTSTFDGTAIAGAVVDMLTRKMDCRGLFATHYHSLVEEHKDDVQTKLGNMTCMVEERDGDKAKKEGEKVVFLYKLEEGACSKSYGLNVARLAGLPSSVLERAQSKSDELEMSIDARVMQTAATAGRKRTREEGGGAGGGEDATGEEMAAAAAAVAEDGSKRLCRRIVAALAQAKAEGEGGTAGAAALRALQEEARVHFGRSYEE
jgi:DNA mismatch repair protein MSH6